MRELKIPVYKLNELSEQSKEIAIEKNKLFFLDCVNWYTTIWNIFEECTGAKIMSQSELGLDVRIEIEDCTKSADLILSEYGTSHEFYTIAKEYAKSDCLVVNDERFIREISNSFNNSLNMEYLKRTNDKITAKNLIDYEIEFFQNGETLDIVYK